MAAILLPSLYAISLQHRKSSTSKPFRCSSASTTSALTPSTSSVSSCPPSEQKLDATLPPFPLLTRATLLKECIRLRRLSIELTRFMDNIACYSHCLANPLAQENCSSSEVSGNLRSITPCPIRLLGFLGYTRVYQLLRMPFRYWRSDAPKHSWRDRMKRITLKESLSSARWMLRLPRYVNKSLPTSKNLRWSDRDFQRATEQKIVTLYARFFQYYTFSLHNELRTSNRLLHVPATTICLNSHVCRIIVIAY